MSTLLKLRLQYCRDGHDITNQPLYGEDDADEIRVWDGDFCQATMTRACDEPDQWRVTSSDAILPDGVECLTFASPTTALSHLAQQGRFRYEITE